MKDWIGLVQSFNSKLDSLSRDIQTQRQFMADFDEMYRGLVTEVEAKQWHKAENAKLKKLMDGMNEWLLEGGVYEALDLSSSSSSSPTPIIVNILPTGKIEVYSVKEAVDNNNSGEKTTEEKPVLDDGERMFKRLDSFEILGGDAGLHKDNMIARSLESSKGNKRVKNSLLGKLSKSLSNFSLNDSSSSSSSIIHNNNNGGDEKDSSDRNMLTSSEAQKLYSIPLDLKTATILKAKNYQTIRSLLSRNIRYKYFVSNRLVQLEFRDGSVCLWYLSEGSYADHFVNTICGLGKRVFMDSVKRNFDVKTMSHVELLFRLWKCMNLPNEPEIVSSEWLIIGFQNKDPLTDFRSMGIYPLTTLVYYASNCYPSIQKQFANHSMQYPWAVAGIHVSRFLMESLRLSDETVGEVPFGGNKRKILEKWESPLLAFLASPGHPYSPRWSDLSESLFSEMAAININRNSYKGIPINGPLASPSEPNAAQASSENFAARSGSVLEEFFCFCMDVLFLLYRQRKAGYMDFPIVFKDFTNIVIAEWLVKNKCTTFYELYENVKARFFESTIIKC